MVWKGRSERGSHLSAVAVGRVLAVKRVAVVEAAGPNALATRLFGRGRLGKGEAQRRLVLLVVQLDHRVVVVVVVVVLCSVMEVKVELAGQGDAMRRSSRAINKNKASAGLTSLRLAGGRHLPRSVEAAKAWFAHTG